jgi:hypothetical protein
MAACHFIRPFVLLKGIVAKDWLLRLPLTYANAINDQRSTINDQRSTINDQRSAHQCHADRLLPPSAPAG